MAMSFIEAKDSLLAALRASGALSAFTLDDEVDVDHFSLQASGQKRSVPFSVTVCSRADSAFVGAVISRSLQTPWDRVVVVADRIPLDARDALAEAGISWYDRRGHLQLTGQGIYIDVTVKPDPRPATTTAEGIRGRSGLAYATAVLLSPQEPRSLRAIARASELSAPSISTASAALRRAALVTEEGRPLIPDLFWALADAWNPRFVHLGGSLHDFLDKEAGRPVLGAALTPGWALTGDIAARAWGASLVLRPTAAPAFYVPDLYALRVARRFLGDATHESHSCSIAVAPTPLACSTRVSRASAAVTEYGHFLFAPPLFPALELAGDLARGREILSEWSPPGDSRVW